MRCFLYITGVHGLHAHASLDARAADRYGVHTSRVASRIATFVEIAVCANNEGSIANNEGLIANNEGTIANATVTKGQ